MKKYKSGNLFEKLKRDNLRTLNECDGDDDINDEDIELPKRLDYREKGALNPIVSQGSCGSCSTFSVVSIVEAYYFLKKDKLYKFSEQQIVDCLSEKTKDNYCDGSARSDILKYVKDYGLMLSSEYPYISGQSSIPHKCKYNEDKIVTKIDNFECKYNVKPINIKKYIYKYGPIVTGVNGDCIKSYKNGIIDYNKNECEQEITHSVSIVGWDFDFTTSTTYWIVRNSWGDDWGIDGYFYVKYGENVMGIEKFIYFINSEKSNKSNKKILIIIIIAISVFILLIICCSCCKR